MADVVLEKKNTKIELKQLVEKVEKEHIAIAKEITIKEFEKEINGKKERFELIAKLEIEDDNIVKIAKISYYIKGKREYLVSPFKYYSLWIFQYRSYEYYDDINKKWITYKKIDAKSMFKEDYNVDAKGMTIELSEEEINKIKELEKLKEEIQQQIRMIEFQKRLEEKFKEKFNKELKEWRVVKVKFWEHWEYIEDAGKRLPMLHGFIVIENIKTGERRYYKAWEVFDFGVAYNRFVYDKKKRKWIPYYNGEQYPCDPNYDKVDNIDKIVFELMPDRVQM